MHSRLTEAAVHHREPVSGFVQPRQGHALNLLAGQLYFGTQAGTVRTLLGSCVALVLWHPQRRIGAMCHYLLPGRQRRDGSPDARFDKSTRAPAPLSPATARPTTSGAGKTLLLVEDDAINREVALELLLEYPEMRIDTAENGAEAVELADGSGVDITPPGGTPGQGTSTAAPPVRLPAPIKLAFDVAGQAKKFDYQARAELVWQHDGARYEARQEVSAFLVGSRTQRSTGLVTAQGLQPERFGDRNRSERAAHFDYERGRVTFSANTPEAAIGPGAQDRLSVFIQLAGLLAATPDRFAPGTQLTLTTVSATGADRWTFTVEATETLNLPAGTLPALKLQRLPRRDYDQKAELWLAPDMGYLPVRIKITQANGDFADLRLRNSSPP